MSFLFRKNKVSDPFYSTWYGIFGLSALLAALDSCFVLFAPLRLILVQMGISTDSALYAAILVLGIYIYVIDYALGRFYPVSIERIVLNFRGNKDNTFLAMNVLTLLFCFVQISTTIGVSFYLRHDSAKMSVEKPILTDIAKLEETSPDPSVLSIEKDINRLRDEKSQAIANSQKNRELQRLSDSGNGWAINQLNQRKKDAALPFDKQIRILEDKKAGISETNAQRQLEAIQGAKTTNDFEIDNYNKKSEHLANFMLYFAIGATIIECFAGLMLGLYRSIYGLGSSKPFTPTDKKKTKKTDDVITDSENPETVITNDETVITDLNGKKQQVSDAYVREIMTELKADLNNLKTGHGTHERVFDRIVKKSDFLLEVIKNKNITDSQHTKARAFYDNEVMTVINNEYAQAA